MFHVTLDLVNRPWGHMSCHVAKCGVLFHLTSTKHIDKPTSLHCYYFLAYFYLMGKNQACYSCENNESCSYLARSCCFKAILLTVELPWSNMINILQYNGLAQCVILLPCVYSQPWHDFMFFTCSEYLYCTYILGHIGNMYENTIHTDDCRY